jgi:hypothetical protein
MHTALKSALSKTLTLVNASTLSRRALAAVDNAVKAAVAPGGMLAERISKEVTLAVIDAVDCIVAREINPRVHETLNNVFTSYRGCVLTECHLAEMELKTYFQAQQELARTEYQGFLNNSTSASIAKIKAMLDAGEARLNATLCSTKRALNQKGTSVVAAITSAQLPSTPPTPALVTPPLTSLGTRADNATPVGASRGAWGNSPCHSTPATSSPHASNPSKSPIVDASRDRTQHGGVHPGHLDSPQRGGAPPVDPSALGFALGSCVHFNKDSARSGGARIDHNWPSRLSGTHDGSPRPNPTGSTLHKTPPMSYDSHSARSESSNEYHCGQYGKDIDIALCEDFLYRVGFNDTSVYSKIICMHRIIRNSWHNLHYNSFGPQPERILKLNAFSTRLLLKKFDAPLVVAWYERLTSTCEGFQIALIPFDAIQF